MTNACVSSPPPALAVLSPLSSVVLNTRLAAFYSWARRKSIKKKERLKRLGTPLSPTHDRRSGRRRVCGIIRLTIAQEVKIMSFLFIPAAYTHITCHCLNALASFPINSAQGYLSVGGQKGGAWQC